jgi:hypothetical protein
MATMATRVAMVRMHTQTGSVLISNLIQRIKKGDAGLYAPVILLIF